MRRAGDVLWVCIEARFARTVERLQLRNAILCESFRDQVNIVQTTIAGTKRSVLFTRGDGAKRLF